MEDQTPGVPANARKREILRTILLLLGAVFLVLAVPTACGALMLGQMWKDPPRKLDAPLRVGMTIAEVGRARPTEYTLEHPDIEEAAAAKRNMTRFNGWMWVTDPQGDEVSIRLDEGKCSDERSPTGVSRTAYDLTPVGTSVAQVMRKLGPRYKLRFVPDSSRFELPKDAPRLKAFTGTLTGYESTGWTFYYWHVAFRRGIVRSVNETVDYD